MDFSHKAQSLAEYAIVFSVVLAALIGMQVYVKRGLQAKVKAVVDATTKGQYEPYYTDSEITTQQMQKIATTHSPGGRVGRDWLPTVKDEQGNYKEGNIVERKGTIKTRSISDEELSQDDAWEKGSNNNGI